MRENAMEKFAKHGWQSGQDIVNDREITLYELFSYIKAGLPAYTHDHKIIIDSDYLTDIKKILLNYFRAKAKNEHRDRNDLEIDLVAQYECKARCPEIFNDPPETKLLSFTELLNNTLVDVWKFQFKISDVIKFFSTKTNDLISYDKTIKKKQSHVWNIIRTTLDVPHSEIQRIAAASIENDLRNIMINNRKALQENAETEDSEHEYVSLQAKDTIDKPIKEGAFDLPQYSFKRQPTGYWNITFNGVESATISNVQGLQYIAYLLERPGKNFSCLELYQEINKVSPDTMTDEQALANEVFVLNERQAVNKYITKKQYLARIEQLKREAADGDTETKMICKEEIDAIKCALNDRTFTDDRSKKQKLLRELLKTAYKKILADPAMTECVKHLSKYIKTDGLMGLMYVGEYKWEVNIY